MLVSSKLPHCSSWQMDIKCSRAKITGVNTRRQFRLKIYSDIKMGEEKK